MSVLLSQETLLLTIAFFQKIKKMNRKKKIFIKKEVNTCKTQYSCMPVWLLKKHGNSYTMLLLTPVFSFWCSWNAAEMITLRLIISCYNTNEQTKSLNAQLLNHAEVHFIMDHCMEKVNGAIPVLLLHETCNPDHRTFPTSTKKWREEKNYFSSNVCACTTTIIFYIFIRYLIPALSKPVRSHND